MKIAYVITRSDEIGGAHVHVRDMACWMVEHGHQVRVFVGAGGNYIDSLCERGLEVVPLNHMVRSIRPWSDVRAIFELESHLRSDRPEIVSAHSAKAGVIARIACRQLDIPCIFTAHGWSFAEGVPAVERQVYRMLERHLAQSSSAIITVCARDRALAENAKLRCAGLLTTIHNGMPDIPPEQFANPGRDRVAQIVTIARFEPQKDYDTLFKALSSLEALPWEMTIVGDGPNRARFEKALQNTPLESRVHFLGRRNDVADILAHADLYVLSSLWEGFPRSILEAMRAGLPVVATDVGGVREAVADGVTGWVVAPGDESALAGRLAQLIEDPALRATLGKAGRANFQAEFLFSDMAERTFQVYRHVVDRTAACAVA